MRNLRTDVAMLRTLGEVARLPGWTGRLLAGGRIRIFGLDRLHGATVVATAHVGNWELAAQVLGAVAGPASVLYRADRRPQVERWIRRHRDPCVEFIPAGPAGFRLALRRLAEHRRVVVTVDQDRMITAFTCRAAAALARRAGARLIPAILIRRPGRPARRLRAVACGGRYRFAALVGRPLFASSNHLAAVMNRLVLRYDDQWCQRPRRMNDLDGEPARMRAGDHGCRQDARAC